MLPNKIEKIISGFPEHRAILKSAIRNLSENKYILGICITGSFASGDIDCYSDIDLLIILKEEHLGNIWKNRISIENGIGKTKFRIDLTEIYEYSSVAFYEKGIKLHITFYDIATLPIDEEYRNIEIILSREIYINDWASKCRDLHKPISVENINIFDKRFYFWAMQGASKIARGELWAAFDTLNILREIMIYQVTFLKKIKYIGYRKLEKDWDKESIDSLGRTIATIEKKSLVRAYSSIISDYHHIKDQLCIKNKIQFLTKQNEIDYVLNIIKNYLS